MSRVAFFNVGHAIVVAVLGYNLTSHFRGAGPSSHKGALDGPAGCTIVGFDRGSRRHEQLGYRLATCQLVVELFPGRIHTSRPARASSVLTGGPEPLCRPTLRKYLGNSAFPKPSTNGGRLLEARCPPAGHGMCALIGYRRGPGGQHRQATSRTRARRSRRSSRTSCSWSTCAKSWNLAPSTLNQPQC